jgi:hypothetical protein
VSLLSRFREALSSGSAGGHVNLRADFAAGGFDERTPINLSSGFQKVSYDSATELRELSQMAANVATGAEHSDSRVAYMARQQAGGGQIRKDEKDKEENRSTLLRWQAQQAAQKAIEDINRRIEELNKLAERYSNNIEAQNQILQMIRRGEDPFLKDANGNYVYNDLLFDPETGADLTLEEVQSLERRKTPEQRAAALETKKEAKLKDLRSAEEGARDLTKLREEYENPTGRISDPHLRNLSGSAGINPDNAGPKDLGTLQQYIDDTSKPKPVEITDDLAELAPPTNENSSDTNIAPINLKPF